MQILCSSTFTCRFLWPHYNSHLLLWSAQAWQPHQAHLSFHHFRHRKLSKSVFFSYQKIEKLILLENLDSLLTTYACIMQLLLGIVASATGAAAGVAYIGLKGNKHVQWNKICNLYGDFCKHIGASVAVSLFGSVVLVLLVVLSVHSLSKKIPKHNHSH